MGPGDSPLRDRVVFVEGAPRSGTTLLSAMLAAHEEVAAITAEPRVFEYGVKELWDNFEESGFLDAFVTREQLLDLTRDLVDGILGAMLARQKPGARYVVEKTPAPRSDAAPILRRKRQLYPDGWYLHIVRDEDAVVRSLMRAPWNDDRSRTASAAWWREAVEATREAFADLPRYREVAFAELAADPVGVTSEALGWLGLEVFAEDRARMAKLAGLRFADLGPPGRPPDAAGRALARKAARRLLGPVRAHRDDPAWASAKRFAEAFRRGDRGAITAELSPAVELTIAGEIELDEAGSRAVDALLRLGSRAFEEPLLSEAWSMMRGEGHATAFRGVRQDGDTFHVWWVTVRAGDRIGRVSMLTAGRI